MLFSRHFVCGIKKNFRLCREMASYSYSMFNPWTKNASPDTEESLFSIGSGNLTHMFFFSPLVLGKARNGRDTMEPFEPSLFLLGFISPQQRSLCFWFHRPAGPVPDKPGVSFAFPLGPRVGWGPWTLSIAKARCRVCRREQVLLCKFGSSQKQDVVRGAWHPPSLPSFTLFLFCFLILTFAVGKKLNGTQLERQEWLKPVV